MEEARLPGAKQSPRIDTNNVIKWYYGDTFEIQLHLVLKRDGDVVEYAPEDQFIFSFYNKDTQKLVKRFVCTEIDNEAKLLTLKFDKEISMDFKPGRYSFGVKYISNSEEDSETQSVTEDITTVGAKYSVEVERCY
ncbi:MAG: hypothetical protein J6T10_04540 [Methanobrevibacter sp.]|nr:hypothetical protein [Methanobrevibacter sp.]